MTEAATTRDAARAQLTQAGLRRVLVVLCLTEITSWGVLYYAFTVLAPTIGRDTGWSTSAVTAAFSVSQITAAVVGVPVGRLLDRHGPRMVMTAGSVLAVPATVVIANAGNLGWFFAGWIAAGAAMAAVLYQPAFAALTRWWGPRRVTALTGVTLIAGLSSTVFAPLTAALVTRLGWRPTYLLLAVVLALVTIPAHAIGLRGPWPRLERRTNEPQHAPDQVARSRPFVMLAIAMSLASFAVYAVIVNQIPLLTGRGLSLETAALALGLSGAGQVCGRLFYAPIARYTSIRGRTALILCSGATMTALLGLLPGPAWLLVTVAILVGATRGLFTLLQATAISDRWGEAHYGTLNGILSAPVLLATASAPWAGTAIANTLGGYPFVFAVLAGCAFLAAAFAWAAKPGRRE
ncbi:MFS transporter [Flindersiella endophytica]